MNIISTVKKTNCCKKHNGKYQLEPGHKPVRPQIQLPPETALQNVHVPGRETHTSRHQRVGIKTPELPHSSFSVLLMIQCSLNVWIYKALLFHTVKADKSTLLFLLFASQFQLRDFCLP